MKIQLRNFKKTNSQLALFSFVVAIVIVFFILLFVIFGDYRFGSNDFYTPSLFVAVYLSENPHNYNTFIFFSTLTIQIFLMVYLISFGAMFLWNLLIHLGDGNKSNKIKKSA